MSVCLSVDSSELQRQVSWPGLGKVTNSNVSFPTTLLPPTDSAHLYLAPHYWPTIYSKEMTNNFLQTKFTYPNISRLRRAAAWPTVIFFDIIVSKCPVAAQQLDFLKYWIAEIDPYEEKRSTGTVNISKSTVDNVFCPGRSCYLICISLIFNRPVTDPNCLS